MANQFDWNMERNRQAMGEKKVSAMDKKLENRKATKRQ